jgi:hypothetical protein
MSNDALTVTLLSIGIPNCTPIGKVMPVCVPLLETSRNPGSKVPAIFTLPLSKKSFRSVSWIFHSNAVPRVRPSGE